MAFGQRFGKHLDDFDFIRQFYLLALISMLPLPAPLILVTVFALLSAEAVLLLLRLLAGGGVVGR